MSYYEIKRPIIVIPLFCAIVTCLFGWLFFGFGLVVFLTGIIAVLLAIWWFLDYFIRKKDKPPY